MADSTTNQAYSTGYLELVRRNHNFRNLWFGQIISLMGDWFNLIASASLIALLTQSGLAVGGLFVIRMLAQFIASPVGGVLADRFNRKRLLILYDIMRAVTVLGFLLVHEPGDIWLLYTLTAIQMVFAGLFFPTRNAILPDVVSERELGAANALSAATWSTMLAFGAALGGLVAGEWGLKPAFIIDSLTFIISAIFISRVNYQMQPLQEGGDASFNIFGQYAEGLRYLRSNKNVLILALQKASMALGVTSVFEIIQVSLSTKVYTIGNGGSTSLGLFYAMVGVGTGIGPIITRIFTRDDEVKMRRTIALGYVVAAIGLVIISLLVSFPVVLFGTLMRGYGVSMMWVFSTQLLLQLVPNRVRGRVFATEYAIMTLATAVGVGLGGLLFDILAIDIPQMLLGMAFTTLLLGIMWTFAGLLRPSKQSVAKNP